MERANRPKLRMPFAAHILAVTLVLAGGAFAVGTGSSFLPDEGAVIIQARMLANGNGWIERPALLARIDPGGRWYPLANADQTARGFAPFAKHPLYALIAAGGYLVGGANGVIVLSMIGTLAAALLSASLARRFDDRLRVPALWVVAIASPLLFDAYVATAATLAAALGAAAVVALTHVVQRRDSRLRVVMICAGAVAVALATLLRSEAFPFAVALGLAATALAVIRRRTDVAVGGAVVVGAGIGARAVEAGLRSRVLGAPSSAGVPLAVLGSSHRSYLDARWQGFLHTWLSPSLLHESAGDALLVMAWVLVAVLALLVRRRVADAGILTIVGGVLCIATVGRLVIVPRTPVPGLLLAFPVLWGGMLLIGSREWDPIGGLCIGTAVLFSGAVLATQYMEGGAHEWGGRYFAMALPVIVPPIIAACRRFGLEMPRHVRRIVVVSALVPSLALAALAVSSLASQHAHNRRFGIAIKRFSAPTAQPAVVITNIALAARLEWPVYAGRDWLLAPADQFGIIADKVGQAGRDEIALVTVGVACSEGEMPGWHAVDRTSLFVNGLLWSLSTFRAGPGPRRCDVVSDATR